MSEANFQVKSHIVPGQHIREYPNSTATSEDVLMINVKQYIPLGNRTPQFGDVTIIATHANGFASELYEPMWDALLEFSRSDAAGFGIRGIWIADMANQNASGVLNEEKLGRDFHWFDHSRDLLRVVDTFRTEMPMPIVGIGHSIGAAQLVGLAQMHPRLLSNMVLIDPQILKIPARHHVALTKATAFQPDLWSCRADAESAMRKSPVYRNWDSRVLDLHMKTFFRETPTTLYPDVTSGSVTKRTSKEQTFFTVHRPNFKKISMLGRPATTEERRTHPDVDSKAPVQYPFYASGQRQAFLLLPTLRPAVLFIHGTKSPISGPAIRKARLGSCGIGPGGSGGVEIGRVKESLLPGGHFLPFELVSETANAIAEYLGSEMREWKEAETERLRSWNILSAKQKQTIDDEVLSRVRNYDKSTQTLIRRLWSKI